MRIQEIFQGRVPDGLKGEVSMKNWNRSIDIGVTKSSEVSINLSGQVADIVGFWPETLLLSGTLHGSKKNVQEFQD